MATNIKFKVFHGPNFYVSFPAVGAEFISPFSEKISVALVKSLWHLIDESDIWDEQSPFHDLSFAEVATHIAIAIQYSNHDEPIAKRIKTIEKPPKVIIFLGFIDPEISASILNLSTILAESIFHASKGHLTPLKSSVGILKKIKQNLSLSLPQRPIIRALVNEAKQRSIPVYPVAKNSGIWLFGQGAAGVHYYEAANHRDSFTGMRLQQDKSMSNLLIKRLGFPGVQHALATNLIQANKIACKIGYPLVVKPPSSGKGNGVSAFVINAIELTEAFNKAQIISSGAVIIESHVKGNDHRLAVFGGKLAWVAARYPAQVLGDGKKSIRDLISLENQRRDSCPQAAKDGLKRINLNKDVLSHLHKQDLTADSKPADGQKVTLQDVANLSKGGTVSDQTDFTHPDNIEMAEALARGFRMDTMGIDFITPDISKSWRDTPCAVIEINGSPGIFFDQRIKKILDARFPKEHDGRIPTILLVSPPSGYSESICQILIDNNKLVGYTDSLSTMMNGQARCHEKDPLHSRIDALIADPCCEAIVISMSIDDLTKLGMPLDWIDIILTFKPISNRLMELLRKHSGFYTAYHPNPSELISTLIKTKLNI